MITMRSSSIFKSRWMALLWSAGILWLALAVAGPAEEQNAAANAAQATDATGGAVSSDDENRLAEAFNGF